MLTDPPQPSPQPAVTDATLPLPWVATPMPTMADPSSPKSFWEPQCRTLIAPLCRIGGSGRPDAASDLPAAPATAAVLQVLRLNFNRGKST
eukprot:SAG31_NODE_14950_length_778_cov_4.926362_1_plen_91_part_00